eukprot:TRINITY_DN729_c0_g1_i1.p1 TRINITY_DN729_c0_g1~~TRINITY_DN729_c0_g1_i1.p1  ORF type:complete len:126 (-),score=33.45 TRINITY_DN729_c0_g1_i1:30-407(-)
MGDSYDEDAPTQMDLEDVPTQQNVFNDVEVLGNDEVDMDALADEDTKIGRVTTKYMTKYERARILGTRARQISMNAPILVDLEGETDPLQIALKELRQGKIPLIIRRRLPDGSYEDWSVDQLIID